MRSMLGGRDKLDREGGWMRWMRWIRWWMGVDADEDEDEDEDWMANKNGQD